MASSVDGVYARDLQEKIRASKLLVVGAGGIGCEILKNLVLSGFPEIEIIDLDTIDVSNLNRQFLFHKEHVGKSKAQVARESALTFNPNVNIVAHHDSITSNRFGVGYFQNFTLVLNALDNRAARNHVNRMCLTANVPLIESGTAGYNGQVELIKKGVTQCYECTPKAAQKSFPGCTIRNTPSEPIHCIVWAKHLFNQLFGEDNADEDVSPDTADPEAASNAGTDALASEANEKGNVERQSTRAWAQGCSYDAEKLFNKFFRDDIQYLLSMSNLWKTRTPPKPLTYGDIVAEPSTSTDNGTASTAMRDQRVWTMPECAQVMASSIQGLCEQVASAGDKDNQYLVWDKDDKHAMDFVAACACIRAQCFHIPQKSRFEIKSMAGNIIPAIATTNAITAGVVVLHAYRVLRDEIEKCQNVYMRLRPNARNQIVTQDRNLVAPNPKCYVCSSKPEIVVRIDTERMTIKEFRDDVLVKALNTVDPDVMIDGTGTIVISSEEGETECNNMKLLKDMAIVDGCVLKVDDFHQNYELGIIIVHQKADYDQPLFEVIADPSQLQPVAEAEEKGDAAAEVCVASGSGTANAKDDADDDDDLVIVEPETEPSTSTASVEEATADEVRSGTKRKAEDKDVLVAKTKKSKIPDAAGPSGDSFHDEDIILID